VANGDKWGSFDAARGNHRSRQERLKVKLYDVVEDISWR